MNLLEVRTKFIELSGRYDLVQNTTSFADNGADFFINRGMRFLERRFTPPQATARVFTTLALGAWYTTIQRCRTLLDVYLTDDTTGYRSRLTRKSPEWLRAHYPKKPSMVTAGQPVYYAPTVIRTTPMEDLFTIDRVGTEVVYGASKYFGCNAILFMPPADQAYYLELIGQFFHPELSADNDSNWWTVEEFDTLILAALYMVEVHNRNTAGANDYKAQIVEALQGIEFDAVEDDVNQRDQMRGSY